MVRIETFIGNSDSLVVVDVHFKVPLDLPIGNIRALDAMRAEIRAALGEPHVWLTVNFTGRDVEPLPRTAEAT